DPDRSRIAAVREIERLGATVLTPRADVGDREALARLLDDLRRSLPPIRGVIHAAGVVRARGDSRCDIDSFLDVLRPKAAGAWALHELTEALPLDFFVMFSSVASVLGSRASADYAAANRFLDALAHHRAALGLPALSINWGPWA